MALGAGAGVEDRSQAGVNSVCLFKNTLIVGERISRRFGQAVADALAAGIVLERWCGEAGWGFVA